MMDGVASIRSYIDRVVTGNQKCSGMKVLLLDASTTQIVSCVYSQSEVLSKEVYLVSRLDDVGQNPNLVDAADTDVLTATATSHHLKAVCYLRPTEANIGLLVKELAAPRYSEYHIFFSGILSSALLRLLAENDGYEAVKQLQEFYGDYLPVSNHLLTLNCRNTLAMTASAGTSWARDHSHLYERNRRGLEGILLSLKRQPRSIRYQKSSALAQQLARNIQEVTLSDQIFHFRDTNTLLLVLDRMDDPVTPLLSQWTYQAMVHELLGLNNNRVLLKGTASQSKELEEVVLSPQQDEFFRQNQHANFGELGEAIQKLLKNYQATTATHKMSLNTIEDFSTFMDNYPELKSQSYNVSKHVAIMSELARLVDVCSLMDVSQFEQELACAEDHSIHLRELLEKLSSSHIQIPDKLRLGLLYALRYEDLGNIHRVKMEMRRGAVPEEMVDLIDIMLRYAGNRVRGPGLFGYTGSKQENIMSKMTKSFMTSVQGVSNVYSQHVPVLMDTIQAIARGKLKSDSHPYIARGRGFVPSSSGNNALDKGGGAAADIPNEVIIFMTGGVTYEESTKISEFNANNPGKIQVLLSGSTIHNSTSFLEELKAVG